MSTSTSTRETGKAVRGTQGFSFLEILIAMVVMLVGLLSLQMMTVMGLNSGTVSKGMATATILGQQALEQARETGYTNVVSVNQAYGSIPGHPEFARSMVVTDATPEANTKTITVTVSWNSDLIGGAKSVVLTTILAEH